MPATTADERVLAAYAVCERAAGRDKPHLFAAAQQFGWVETRRAFAAAYASMRMVDDVVDNIPHRALLDASSRRAAADYVDRWLTLVRSALSGESVHASVWVALSDTFTRFDLPLVPWENLARAMQSDLCTPVFRDWEHLRSYMLGASVAPAVVFMHLVLMSPDGRSGRFASPWPYERVLAATEDLAIFCYWVHILRDAATDLSAGGDGLVYFPEGDLQTFGLTVADLHRLKDQGRANDAYRRLAAFEAGRAQEHLDRGRDHLAGVLAVAPPVNIRALKQLVDTYVAVLADLSARRFDVFAPPPSGH